MENYFSNRIQIIAIVVSVLFLLYISRLIIKGKLREEYAIFWVVITFILILFAVWRRGIDIVAELVGVYLAPNLVFTGAIFAILIYLLHLSIVVSNLHEKNKVLTREMALMKKRLENLKKPKKADNHETN
ncbi:MAG: DUF2304 domain-containing protein [Bacteroidales bacterium]|nr:DUF2304 domain-containing protein [Bacteroidales bacterium]